MIDLPIDYWKPSEIVLVRAMSREEQQALFPFPHFICTQASGYNIQRSLRLRSAASGYLTRTPGSSGNRDLLTFFTWVKRGSLGSQTIFDAFSDANNRTNFTFNSNNTISLFTATGGSVVLNKASNRVFRDVGAWMALTLQINTANSAYRVWVGEEEITSWGTNTVPAAGTDTWFNHNVAHNIGRYGGASNYLDGYMAETILVEGQALDYTSFLAQDPNTGVWVPKRYTGTYGTRGFYLDYSDNSGATSTTIGADRSGNGNNWTPSGISVTAGVTNDSLTDTPTNFGTDTGLGGEVRGNYATLNPLWLNSNITLASGSLQASSSYTTDNAPAFATAPIPRSGKWVIEATITASSPNSGSSIIGLWPMTTFPGIANGVRGPQQTGGVGYRADGQKEVSGLASAYGASYTTNDTIRCEVDMDAGTPTATYFKNGSSQGSINLTAGVEYLFCTDMRSSSGTYTAVFNFGQRAFANTASAGFKALCTQNFPDPAIKKPSNYFDINLRSGTGSAFSVSGKAFSPDLIWVKGRSGATDHAVYDTARGVQNDLATNSTGAETTQAQGVTAFNSDGFSAGTLAKLNTNAATYVDWMWEEGVVPGLDIVPFTGPSGAGNVAVNHNLGVVPAMFLVKTRSATAGWWMNHKALANQTDKYLELGSTAAVGTLAWGAAPTSTQITVASGFVLTTSASCVAYVFAEVPGFSKFGSYIGNGSSDGPFIYCGFRPRWIMIKRADNTSDWTIIDTSRDSYNAAVNRLFPNVATGDSTGANFDIVSNGLKIRDSGAAINASGGAFVLSAFAEHPFKYTRAR